MSMQSHHVHLVSDATGETVSNVVRACLAQFEDVRVVQHRWWLLRSPSQVGRVIEGIQRDPGTVVFTVVDPEIRRALEEACRLINIPCVALLDPVMDALALVLETKGNQQPGRQYTLDEGYFSRIEAMHFALALDDGQSLDRLKQAEVVVVGVSRTSKTPTCMFLANKGIRAANVPLVPGIDPPAELMDLAGPLVVGLTRDAKSLSDMRRSRLRLMREDGDSPYAEEDSVAREVREARRLYARMGWTVIDVTRKSIEEVAATIMQKLGTAPWGEGL
ncbi:phosphoenolpyruvate synthase regulatory protein [Rhodospirillum rubrum]|uniref:pyruvate, water dikinase regulatory protein n=1 Tax=Rhodospirillum rubrum TaxID=1085 RepID=UPI001908F065|nr:pyruvate, water dikinase regulatory protein [Rhodospirillum rubrum]MBK1663221.1 phosphoenolpyruvate synthase regulatory protein [Rhodospirillum rubrum]MBK1676950.1 phosphoenolpyruvate synthase regulatory protein [Rhodospirillum rubrum]